MNNVFNIIMDYKDKGCLGACLTTKRFGEIILNINGFNVLVTEEFYDFDEKQYSIYEHYKNSIEKAKSESQEYSIEGYYKKLYPFDRKIEIVEFKSVSEFKALNSEYICLNNFWSAKSLPNPLEDKDIMISRMFKIRGEDNSLWSMYNNFTLNCNEVIAIQPIEFKVKACGSGFGNYFKNRGSSKLRIISNSEAKEIEKMFRDAGDGELTNLEVMVHEY